ncbi:hypothetical protein OXX80_002237 [Metschnikowia pulcherrima]
MSLNARFLLSRRISCVSRKIRFGSFSAHVTPARDSSSLDEGNTSTSYNPTGTNLPFDRSRDAEKFGKLVRDEHYVQKSDLFDGQHMKKTALLAEKPSYEASPSPFRNEDGTFLKGDNSEEARLDSRTLAARADSSVIKLPVEIAKVINKNILSAVQPGKLRERAAQIYQALEKEQIQKAPESSLDADAHIAALFLQNYSHAYRALSELKKRVGPAFDPDSVLDVGYGPGTGMIALNELMGAGFAPKTKEVYVVGRSNRAMKKRAKILLSRQLCEIPPQAQEKDVGISELRAEIEESQSEAEYKEEPTESQSFKTDMEEDYVGPVDASQILIRTKLRDALPSTKQYSLIIVNQALLSREYSFPKDVDVNLHMILRLLKPDGHLVIIERGNALGFEIVARARQVMLRPESYSGERGRIPRPYIRGSTVKPQKLRKEDQIITEDHIKHEHALLEKMQKEEEEELDYDERDLAEAGLNQVDDSYTGSMTAHDYGTEDVEGLEAEINSRFGEVSEDEMKFEFEENGEFDVMPVENGSKNTQTPILDDVNYHLSVVAPCSHHGKCPLQLGDPKFYKISGHQHRLQFCSFNQVVERPKYTMELKRGKRLATSWNKSAEDGFGLDKLAKSTRKQLEGSGRPGGNNSESGNFSYLIMHRARNDKEAISEIKDARDHFHEDSEAMPRILETPEKVKKNVRLKVCAPSGNIEYWQIPRSTGKQAYHDARKARQGDLWALGKKSAVVKAQLSEANMEKLKRMSNMQRKFVMKEKRKQQSKKLVSRSASDFDDPLDELDQLATDLEQSKKYQLKGKKAGYDVDLRKYDGK